MVNEVHHRVTATRLLSHQLNRTDIGVRVPALNAVARRCSASGSAAWAERRLPLMICAVDGTVGASMLGRIGFSISAACWLFLLMTNFRIIEPLAMRLTGADHRIAALLHGFCCLWRRTSNRRRGQLLHRMRRHGDRRYGPGWRRDRNSGCSGYPGAGSTLQSGFHCGLHCGRSTMNG